MHSNLVNNEDVLKLKENSWIMKWSVTGKQMRNLPNSWRRQALNGVFPFSPSTHGFQFAWATVKYSTRCNHVFLSKLRQFGATGQQTEFPLHWASVHQKLFKAPALWRSCLRLCVPPTVASSSSPVMQRTFRGPTPFPTLSQAKAGHTFKRKAALHVAATPPGS